MKCPFYFIEEIKKSEFMFSLKQKSKYLSPASFTLKVTFSSGGVSKEAALVLLPLVVILELT